MERYAIADYLPLEGRWRAVAAHYAPCALHPTAHCDRGCCPLGVAIGYPGAPTARTVALVLVPASAARERRAAVQLAAASFVQDWDAGRLTPADLPVALGLAEPA